MGNEIMIIFLLLLLICTLIRHALTNSKQMKNKTLATICLVLLGLALHAQSPRLLYTSQRDMPADSTLFDVYTLMYERQASVAQAKYDSIREVYLSSSQLNDYLFITNEYTYWLRLFGGSGLVSEGQLKAALDTVIALGAEEDFEVLYTYHNLVKHAADLSNKVAYADHYFRIYDVLFPNNEYVSMCIGMHETSGFAYYHLGDMKQTWKHWDYCLEHLDDVADPYWTLRRIANSIKMSQPETALTISKYVYQDIMKRPNDWQKKFTANGGLAVLYNRVEDYESAIECAQEGVAFFESHFEDIRRGMRPHAAIHFALVDAYISTGQHDKAFEVMDKVYAMIDDLGYRGQTLSYMDDAKKRSFAASGQLDSALYYLDKVYRADIKEKTDPEYVAYNYMDNSIQGDLEQYGNYHLMNQQFDSAVWYYKRALRACNMKFYKHIDDESFLIPPHELRGVSVASIMLTIERLLNGLQETYEHTSDDTLLYEMLDYCKYGEVVLKEQFGTLVDEALILSTSEMIKTNASYALYACNALSLTNPNYIDTALVYSDQARSFSLTYLKNLKDKTLDSTQDSLIAEVSRLSIALANTSAGDSISADLVDLTLDLLRAKMLLGEFAAINSELLDFSVDVDFMKNSLAQGEAVIEYFVADTLVYGICYTAQHKKMIQLKMPDCQAQLGLFKRRIKSGAFDEIMAQQLYTVFFESFAEELEGISHLSIITDDLLNEIPFELFLDSKGDFLVKRYAFQYHYSAKSLGKRGEQSLTSVLLVAPGFMNNNHFVAENVTRSLIDSSTMFDVRGASEALSPLVHSLSEVKQIAQEFAIRSINSVLLESEAATESSFKASANGKTIVHLATHGVSLKEGESGLFFSYNVDGVDDGFLRLPELYTLDVDADLVVLSACKSAVGDVKSGEGVIGLPRGFIYAGVPNIIASLWKVHDEKTRYLMVQFYKHLMNGQASYAQALRQAKLDGIAKGYLPLDWSGFVLISE